MTNVYFISSRVKKQKGLLEKFEKLLDYLKLELFDKNDSVLIKTHFGEDGNTAFISPMYIRKVVDYLKKNQTKPFIGDTSTLYSGRRKEGVSHLELAIQHGFGYSTVNAPLVILDGVKSDYTKEIEINKKHFKTVQLGGGFIEADGMIVLSHVKGHIVAGMGASLKNLSMGLGSRTQKQRMHGDIKPQYKKAKCIFCNKCVEICPENAITNKSDEAIKIDYKKCVGCAECITNCPTQALKILWNETPKNLAEKMAETAYAATQKIKDKVYYFNFLTNITPDCDCAPWSDNPVVNDIGILASNDPLAIDQASFDLINKQKKLNNSILENKDGEVFETMHKGIDPIHQVNYGEEIGIGKKEYNLVELGW